VNKPSFTPAYSMRTPSLNLNNTINDKDIENRQPSLINRNMNQSNAFVEREQLNI
jgi:hypothetical protein